MKKVIVPVVLLICCLFILSGCDYEDVSNTTNEEVFENLIEDNSNFENTEVVFENIVEGNSNTTTDNVENISEKKIVEENGVQKEDSFIFGNYGNEPIEWLILENTDNKKLLITKYIIDCKPYNDTTIASSTYWKDSSIRKWLNGDFINTSFSKEEQKQIIITDVQDYKEDKQLGEITKDKVFLLSYVQMEKYLKNAGTIYTAYAKSKSTKESCSWWLIDSYISGLYKHCVNAKGLVENSPRVNEDEGIRPAIWIKSN